MSKFVHLCSFSVTYLQNWSVKINVLFWQPGDPVPPGVRAVYKCGPKLRSHVPSGPHVEIRHPVKVHQDGLKSSENLYLSVLRKLKGSPTMHPFWKLKYNFSFFFQLRKNCMVRWPNICQKRIFCSSYNI